MKTKTTNQNRKKPKRKQQKQNTEKQNKEKTHQAKQKRLKTNILLMKSMTNTDVDVFIYT